MTPMQVYRDAFEFLESIAHLPTEIQLRMIRSYLKHLSDPEDEVYEYPPRAEDAA